MAPTEARGEEEGEEGEGERGWRGREAPQVPTEWKGGHSHNDRYHGDRAPRGPAHWGGGALSLTPLPHLNPTGDGGVRPHGERSVGCHGDGVTGRGCVGEVGVSLFCIA